MNPLIEQVKQREKEFMEARSDQRNLRLHLKMLHAVVRSPKLSDLYAK